MAQGTYTRAQAGSTRIRIRAIVSLKQFGFSVTTYSIAALVCMIFPFQPAQAQRAKAAPSSSTPGLMSYYEAAQNFQENNDLEQASQQYQLFIANALDYLGSARASAGDYAKSSAYFDEALRLAPNHSSIQLDYAEVALAAKDLPRAKQVAESAVAAKPADDRAHRILGRVLLKAGDSNGAKLQLEKAVAIDPNFTNGYALASAYLALKDKEHAAALFHEMQLSLGDKAALHMEFGLAYGEAGFPEEAIEEFKKTIQRDAKFPGAHYSLGASYLLSMGEIDFPKAVAEFQKELQVNPNDFLSHAELGYVALSQHRLPDAENELVRAAALNPTDPDVYMSLGQLYLQTDRSTEAEAALRKTIALTTDTAHNNYQVQRAHYLLARLLLQSNRADEGKQEMQASQDLLAISARHNQGQAHGMSENGIGGDLQWRDSKNLTLIDPQALSRVQATEQQLGLSIADSYNNMGAIAATNKDYAAASQSFENAYKWNPSLDGLDKNWGKAAFYGHLYSEAVAPLDRYLSQHTDDDVARSYLGISLFSVHDFSRAATILEPLASRFDATPALTYVYVQALMETEDLDSGIAQLKALTAKFPQNAVYHRELGKALTRKHDYAEAAIELRGALDIDSSDSMAKYDLALTFIQIEKKDEAEQLLEELAKSGSKNPDVYYRLGKLKLERADAKSAIMNLQKALELSPDSEMIHQTLAIAYRQDSRIEDAAREMKEAEAIHHSHESVHP
ncbi:MAG: tetratricopeptide repeat protein [Terracidiphilus sp.]